MRDGYVIEALQESPAIHRREEQFMSDDRRVITRLFVPGGEDRVRAILGRVIRLSDDEVRVQLSGVMSDFAHRHRNIEKVFENHFNDISCHVDEGVVISEDRRQLIGAYFTMEYSIESAALFNPSIVPHMDQSNLSEGSCRFIMSLRATGEGHISSIVFRTGVIRANGDIEFEPVSPYVAMGRPDQFAKHVKQKFFLKLIEMGAYNELAADILDHLPLEFDYGQLEHSVNQQWAKHGEDHEAFSETAEQVLWLARSNYQLVFPTDCPISEVVIFPVTENESRGIEDARFVRFVDDDGTVIYYGTYTAYNGFKILPQLLKTYDFRTFRVVTLNGRHVQNKGMALFPRRVNERFMMIGRLDGESLYLMSASNVRFWNEATKLHGPTHPWEFVQIGNCGSPIETEHGWILLTHGVGPMRRYCIGAMLLDLEDPSRIIAASRTPIMSPNAKEREGYVPNVVYSCGAMVHGDQIIMPYAMSDSATSIATISVSDLIDCIKA